jgi:hypothetical protein
MKAHPRQEKLSNMKPLTSRVQNANNMSSKASSPPSASSSSAIARKKNQQKDEVDDEVDTSNAAETSPSTPQNATLNSYGGLGYGGSMMGMGMMPGMMGMMGGYGGMMGYGMGMMPGSQWIFSLNQFLFSIQSVIFSLGQAVQIVGMNAQQIRHVYDSIKGMVENALGQVNEWGKLSSWEDVAEEVLGSRKDDAKRWILGDENSHDNDETQDEWKEPLSEHEIIRRRRLAAFRWTLTLSLSYIAYRTVRRLIRALFLGSEPNRYGRDQYSRALPHQYMHGGRGGYQYGNIFGSSGYGGRSYYDSYSPDYGGMGGYY